MKYKETRTPGTKNILIHLHPTFQDFALSVAIAKRIQRGASTVVALEGASLQNSLLGDFYKTIVSAKGILRELYGLSLTRERISWGRVLFSSAGLWKAKSILRSKQFKLNSALWHASRDSLMRRRFAYIYLAAPGIFKRIAEMLEYGWAIMLRNAYLEILDRHDIGIVFLSHASYVPYIALIDAAMHRGIKCVVHEHKRTYTIASSADVYHVNHFLQSGTIDYQWLKHRLGKERAGAIDKTSLFQRDNKSEIMRMKPTKTALVIGTHCIKDTNHTCDPKKMVYENYWEWLLHTVLILTFKRCTFDRIIYKVHPHARLFQDHFLLSSVALLLRLGVNRRKVFVVGGFGSAMTNEGTQKSSICEDYMLVPVTFHGSIALESAIQGIASISAGQPCIPSNAVVRADNKAEYLRIITDCRYYGWRRDGLKIEETKCEEMHNVLGWMDVNGAVSSRDSFERLKDIYYFGSRTDILESDLRNLMREFDGSLKYFLEEVSPGRELVVYV